MSNKPPPKLRSTITDDEFGGFRITIPYGDSLTTSFWLAGFLFVTGVGLALLYWSLSTTIPPKDRQAALGLLGLCVLWEACIIYNLIWCLSGRKIITLTDKVMVIRSEVALFTSTAEYELSKVKNLRCTNSIIHGLNKNLVFNYGRQTIEFGGDLRESEARRMIVTIKSRFKFGDDWDNLEPLPIER